MASLFQGLFSVVEQMSQADNPWQQPQWSASPTKGTATTSGTILMCTAEPLVVANLQHWLVHS